MLRLLIAGCLIAFSLMGLAAELPASITKLFKNAGLPSDAISVFVQKVDSSSPVIAINADQAMNPASVMKLVTTDAALELLGPSYTWRTEAYSNAVLQHDILMGDLVLKGYGDPALLMENFWLLLHQLRLAGIREIRGDLILDNSYFAPLNHDTASFDGAPYRAYNAIPDALLVNFKANKFVFTPDPAGRSVAIVAEPALDTLKINNQLSDRAGACGDLKERIQYGVKHDGDDVVITFSGNYPLNCGEQTLELSVYADGRYTYQLFKTLWQEQGGVLKGGLRIGTLPMNANRLAQVNSEPLANAIRLINKYSNNLMARQLLLTMAAERTGSAATVESGAQVIRDWLGSKHLKFPELVIENGAGLSRNERISARHLGELLLSAYQSPVMPELMSSLPIAGVDGTMMKRLKENAVTGRAHLKTGSLDNVRSVAGYILDDAGHRWVFVGMVNHPRAAAVREGMDALIDWVSSGALVNLQ